ncbi:hypothetical protein AMJ85_05310 [candidate division BRC1 bacterium SM23_51]|nr:MAG: hypothetical protein AMJ85_05310 [candidate division BRC1 bacterium SM23_51]
MAGPNQVLNKTFKAGAAIDIHKIVMFDSADDTVIHATAVTDLPFGISLGAAAALGDRLDVAVIGIGEVKLGGTVNRGDYVVSGAAGVGMPGTASTAKQRAVGIAMAYGVSGDIIPVLICPSQFDLA